METSTRRASMLFIFITILVDVIGLGIIIPVVPTLITSLTGGTLSEASEIGGWLMFAFAIVQFLFAPFLGQLSDRFGRKPVLIAGLFGLGLDYVFHAFAPTIFWLFVGRVIAGFFGASFTVASSYIADISAPEDKAKNFGMIGAAFGLGFIIGPVIGGVAAQWGVEVPFYIAAGLSLSNMIYGIFVVPESLPEEKRRPIEWAHANPWGSLWNLSKYPLLIGFAIAYFLIYLASKSVEATWNYYTMLRFNWTEAEVGYSLAFVGVLVALVQGFLIGKVVKKYGQKKTIYFGFVFWIVGLVLFGMATEGHMMYEICMIYCLGGIAGPTMQGLMSNEVDETKQGELQGSLTSLISVTSIIGPPLFTGIFAWFTADDAPIHLPGAAFFLGAFLALISLLIAARTLRKFY